MYIPINKYVYLEYRKNCLIIIKKCLKIISKQYVLFDVLQISNKYTKIKR